LKKFCLIGLLLIFLLAGTKVFSQPPHLIYFTFSVNPAGKIDLEGRGYYALLFNQDANPIEVSNPDSFTDFIRFDGMQFIWFHRQDNVPPPGYTWVSAGNINRFGHISSDNRTITLIFDLNDPTLLFNQYLPNPCFSVHLLTCSNEKGAYLGKVIDTLGLGPSILNNSLNTVYVNSQQGSLTPYPPFYPMDPLNDWAKQENLPPDFPYKNFDLYRFEIKVK